MAAAKKPTRPPPSHPKRKGSALGPSAHALDGLIGGTIAPPDADAAPTPDPTPKAAATKRAAVAPEPPPEPATAPPVTGERGESGARREAKVRATFHLPTTLVDAARDAAVALSGPPTRLTLAALVESAIENELKRLRNKHNEGKPFPRFGSPLKGGRPIGS